MPAIVLPLSPIKLHGTMISPEDTITCQSSLPTLAEAPESGVSAQTPHDALV
jgi:hypothetical protein